MRGRLFLSCVRGTKEGGRTAQGRKTGREGEMGKQRRERRATGRERAGPRRHEQRGISGRPEETGRAGGRQREPEAGREERSGREEGRSRGTGPASRRKGNVGRAELAGIRAALFRQRRADSGLSGFLRGAGREGGAMFCVPAAARAAFSARRFFLPAEVGKRDGGENRRVFPVVMGETSSGRRFLSRSGKKRVVFRQSG